MSTVLTRRNLVSLGGLTAGTLITRSKAKADPIGIDFDPAIANAHLQDVLALVKQKPTKQAYYNAARSCEIFWDHCERTKVTQVMEQTIRENIEGFLAEQPLAPYAKAIAANADKYGWQVSADRISHMTDALTITDREKILQFLGNRGSFQIMGHSVAKSLRMEAERNVAADRNRVQFVPAFQCYAPLNWPFSTAPGYTTCQDFMAAGAGITFVGTIWAAGAFFGCVICGVSGAIIGIVGAGIAYLGAMSC